MHSNKNKTTFTGRKENGNQKKDPNKLFIKADN